MTLNQYFHIVQEKIRNKDFTVLKINTESPEDISIFLESVNYMMWEWCKDHNDVRTHIFDYIIIPNDVDFDFTSITFEEFMTFLSTEKSKEIEMIDTKNIQSKNTYKKEYNLTPTQNLVDDYWTGETSKRSNGKYELGKYNNKPIELIVGLKQGIIKYDTKNYKIQLSSAYNLSLNDAIQIIKRDILIEETFSKTINLKLLETPFGKFLTNGDKNIKFSILENQIIEMIENKIDIKEFENTLKIHF